jgi:hypothetical protein
VVQRLRQVRLFSFRVSNLSSEQRRARVAKIPWWLAVRVCITSWVRRQPLRSSSSRRSRRRPHRPGSSQRGKPGTLPPRQAPEPTIRLTPTVRSHNSSLISSRVALSTMEPALFTSTSRTLNCSRFSRPSSHVLGVGNITMEEERIPAQAPTRSATPLASASLRL